MTGMLNDEKKVIDPYLPRKCDATHRIILSTDK